MRTDLHTQLEEKQDSIHASGSHESEMPEIGDMLASAEEGAVTDSSDDKLEAETRVKGNVVDAGPDDSTIETLQGELAHTTDKMKRQAAEFQNYKRRTETEKQQMVSFGKSMVLQQLLDVFDDLQRSVSAAKDANINSEKDVQKSFESLRSGVELADQKLMDELKKLNVHIIESVGQPFDEELHEAVMQQPAPDGTEAGVILAEVQRGFRMGDRVLRHAKVIVSS